MSEWRELKGTKEEHLELCRGEDLDCEVRHDASEDWEHCILIAIAELYDSPFYTGDGKSFKYCRIPRPKDQAKKWLKAYYIVVKKTGTR